MAVVAISGFSVPGSEKTAKEADLGKTRDQLQMFGYLAEVLLELVISEVVVGDGDEALGDGGVEDVVVGIGEYPFVDFGLQRGGGGVGDGHVFSLEVEEVGG